MTVFKTKNNVAFRDVRVRRLKGANDPQQDVGVDIASGVTYKVTNSDPNWRQKVVRRVNAGQAYKRCEWRFKPGSFSGYATTPNARGVPSGDVLVDVGGGSMGFHYHPLNDSFPPDRVNLSLRDFAVSKVRGKLRDHTKSMNVVVPLVELRELRGTIRSMAVLTSSMLSTLIDIKRTRGRSALKWASDAWLTYRFGLKPMIGDFEAAAEAVSEYLLKTDHAVRLVASSPTESRLVRSVRGSYPSYFGTNHEEVLQGVSQLKYQVIAGFHVPVTSGNNYRFDSQFGLSFGALPSIAWELIPYSWAVDYFTNVGEFLEDVFMTPPGDTTYVSIARKFEFDYTVTTQLTPFKAVPPAVPVSISYQPVAGIGRYTEFERVPGSALPHPSLRFKSADEIGKSGIFKVLNLASVLAGRRANYKLSPGDFGIST